MSIRELALLSVVAVAILEEELYKKTHPEAARVSEMPGDLRKLQQSAKTKNESSLSGSA